MAWSGRVSRYPIKLTTTKKSTKQQKEKSPYAFSWLTPLNSDEVIWNLSETTQEAIAVNTYGYVCVVGSAPAKENKAMQHRNPDKKELKGNVPTMST